MYVRVHLNTPFYAPPNHSRPFLLSPPYSTLYFLIMNFIPIMPASAEWATLVFGYAPLLWAVVVTTM